MKKRMFYLVIVLMLLVGCGQAIPSKTAVPPTITAISPTVTVIPTATATPKLCGVVGTPQAQQQTSYTTQNSAISGNGIRSLYMNVNFILIGHTGDKAGVDLYTGTTWYHCLSTVIVNDSKVDWAGRLWVATDGQGVWEYYDGSWRQFQSPDIDSRTYHITLDWANQKVFASTWEGVWLFNDGNGTWSQDYVIGKNIFQQHIDAFAIGSGCMFFGSIIDGGTMSCNNIWNPLSTPKMNLASAILKLGGDNIRDIEFQDLNQQYVWFISDGGKPVTVYDIVDNQWATYSLPNDLDNRGQNIDFDRYGRPWLATYGGVFYNTSSNGMALGQWIQITSLPSYSIALGCEGCAFSDTYVIGTQTSGLLVGKIPPQ